MSRFGLGRNLHATKPGLLGWFERKATQLFSISLSVAGVVFVAIGTYALGGLLLEVFELLEALVRVARGSMR